MHRAPFLLGLIVLGGLTAGGCSPPMETFDDKTIQASEQFRKIGIAYNKAFQAKKRPPTAEDLKAFLKWDGDPDKLLVSPLDGQPIVIVPGFNPTAPAAEDERSIVAYEKTGVNGRRMTVDIRGTVVFATDQEFAKIKFAGGHRPGEK
jgi:hypothetical protein